MSAKDLLLSAIAKKNVSPVEIPELPELNKKIYVRVLSAAERHLYGSAALHAREEGEFLSEYEIAAICACDKNGEPLFLKKDADGRLSLDTESVNRLREVDGRAVYAIAKKALEVSGLSGDSRKKKSEETQSDSSHSD